VAESPSSQNISTLTQRIAEQLMILCPHVPAAELTDLSSRLAFTELANAAGVTFDQTGTDESVMTEGNQIVWLPGSSSAIVLPSGEEEPGFAVTAARAGAWLRRYGAPLLRVTTRGSAAFRQVGSGLVDAYRARLRVQ